MVFTIYDLLSQWQSAGIFDILLPFLLIFAVIFGILASTNILGGHRGVNLVIALVIGLIAIRLPFVSAFFTEFFPRLGIVLAVLIGGAISIGIFVHQHNAKGWFNGLAIAGIVFAIIAALLSFNQFGWFGSIWWQDYWGLIIGGIILVIVIIAIFVTAAPKSPTKDFAEFIKFRPDLSGGK